MQVTLAARMYASLAMRHLPKQVRCSAMNPLNEARTQQKIIANRYVSQAMQIFTNSYKELRANLFTVEKSQGTFRCKLSTTNPTTNL